MPLSRTDRQIDSAKRAQSSRLGQSGASGKRKRCRKGKSCGASCISSSKFCLVDIPWASGAVSSTRDMVSNRNRPEPTPKPDNRRISEKLKDKLPDFDVKVSPTGGALRLSRVIDGNRLDISVANFRTIVFAVNGSLDAQNLPRSTSVRIGAAVHDATRELSKLLPEGTTLEVSAYTGDGKGEKRARAYERQGFSKPDYPGAPQTGRIKEGKIVPIPNGEYYSDNTRLEFKEGRSRAANIVDWHIILFGDTPEKG